MKNTDERIERLDMLLRQYRTGRYNNECLIFEEIIPMISELVQDVDSLKKQLNDLQKPNAYWRKNI
jgi:hypothetical protein